MATMKRKPSSEGDQIDPQGPEDSSMDLETPSAEETNYAANAPDGASTEVKTVSPKNEGMSSQDRSTIVRGIAGAAPALMSFLFGASPLAAEQAIQDSQKQYLEGAPKKLAMTVGPDGKPQYTDIRNAPGLEPYIKPARNSSASSLSPITYKDPVTGLEAIGSFNKGTGQVGSAAGELVKNPVKYQAPQYKEVTDEKGNKKIIAIGPTSGVSNVAGVARGVGDKYNLREDEVQQGNGMVEKFMQETKSINEQKASLKGAINLLNAPDSDAITQAAGIFRTAKAIVNERLSDQERGFVTAPPGMFEKLSQRIETISTNQNPKEQLRQLRAVLVELDKANNDALYSVQDRYVRTFSDGGQDKNKMKFISDKIVAPTDINVSPPVRSANHSKQQLGAMPDAQLDRIIQGLKDKGK
jgi:hypothetical protein